MNLPHKDKIEMLGLLRRFHFDNSLCLTAGAYVLFGFIIS